MRGSLAIGFALFAAVTFRASAAEVPSDIHGKMSDHVPMAAPIDRSVLVSGIIAAWRGEAASRGWDVEAWQGDMDHALGRASDLQLFRLKNASSLDEVRKALGASIVPLALGDEATDLVYFPLTPCRILDTRSAISPWNGPWPAASSTYLYVNGASVASQGGNADGCGVPTDPAAVVVNFTAVKPAGAGNLRVYRYGDPPPTASALNYAAVTGLNIGNTAIVPLCQFCGPDFRIQVDVSATHVVGDVVGYFWKPSGYPTAGQAFAHYYGSILQTGRTKGFESISHPASGTYCLVPGSGVDLTKSPPLLTVDYSGSESSTVAQWRNTGIGCGAGELAVYLWNSSTGAAVSGAFTVFVP